MNVIGSLETQGEKDPYTAVGDKHLPGGSRGKFQYRPQTWKEYAKATLGDPNAPMTVENQYKVTYLTMKKWKDSGLTPQEIDARWNGATVKGGRYVHNAKDREQKFVNAFNSYISQAPVVTKTTEVKEEEPRFGARQETSQEMLARLQQGKAQRDEDKLKEIAGREGFVDNAIGTVKDVTEGFRNAGERLAGNTLTAGNTVLKKLGLGTDNPLFTQGSEVNKFATGEGTAGVNVAQKVGGFGGDATSILAPIPGTGKITGAVRGMDLIKKLASGGKVANTVARAIPAGLGLTGDAIRGSVALEGEIIDPKAIGFSLGAGAAVSGVNRLVSGAADKQVLTKLQQAIDSGDETAVQAVRNSPEFTKLQARQGITTEAGVAKKVQEERGKIRKMIEDVPNSKTAIKIDSATSDEGIDTFLGAFNPTVRQNGKLSMIETQKNLAKQQEKIGSELSAIKAGIDENPSIALNQMDVKEISKIAKDLAKQKLGNKSFSTIEQIVGSKGKKSLIDSEIDSALTMTGGKMKFSDFDRFRLSGNEAFDMDSPASIAKQFLAEAVRKKSDDILKNAIKSSDEDTALALKYFSDLNKQWGATQEAMRLSSVIEKLPADKINRLTTLLGATIATGGSYNPFAFLAGTYVSDKIVQALNKASQMNRVSNVVTKATQKVPKNNVDEIVNIIKTPKLKPGSSKAQLKDPRSLRDILLNQPK